MGARNRTDTTSPSRWRPLAISLVVALVAPTGAAATTVTSSVASASDDAEERTGGLVITNSTDLELVDEAGQPQFVGIRFDNLAIPTGVTITSATIRFTVDEATSAATNLMFRAQNVDDATAFTSTTASISTRPMTGASVAWAPPAWPTIGTSGVDQTTPNLAAVVQAVINRPGWSPGNALVFIVTGSGARIAEAYEAGASLAPKLTVDYQTAQPTDPPTVASLSPTSGSPGQSVAITGANFSGATQVQFNGTSASFTVTDPTRILATVPAGATSGAVTVTNAVGTGTSPGNFTIVASTAIQVPGDHPTIQAAVTAATSGATIQVAPGTYAPFVVDKPLTIQSHYPQTNDAATIAATVIRSSGSGATVLVQPTASGTTLQGFTLNGGSTNGPSTLDGVRALTTVSILDNRLTGFGDALDFDPPLTDPAYCYCQRNTIENNGDDAIDLDGAGNGVITDNILRNNRDDGIETRLYESATPLTIIIRGNTITGNGQDGIQLIDEPGVSNRSYTIDRNVIANNSRAGLGMMDNSITTEDYRAASIQDPVNLTNNTFVGNNHGLSGGDNLAGANNIFVGNSVGVKGVDGGSRLTHSLLWNNTTAVVSSNVDAASRIDANPLLDPTWKPASGSPAIDSGTASFVWGGRTIVDLAPTAYSGSAPDRGAIETAGSDRSPPTITSRVPTDGAVDTESTATVQATFSEAMDPATVSPTTVTLANDASGAPVAATVTYDGATRTVVLTPNSPLAVATVYRATILGGPTGVADVAGNRLTSNSTWTFTTAAADTTPPQTTITAGPTGLVGSGDATVTFTANEPGSTFTCTLDGGAGGTCSSPATFTSLTEGVHVFTVAATDSAGNTDPTPATRTWEVDTTAPPPPTILTPTSGATLTSATVTVTGSATPDAVISLSDGGGAVGTATASATGNWAITLTAVANGSHIYTATAADAAGNASPPSAAVAVTIAVPTPIVQTFAADADAWINQASSATNYGAATTLSTDLNSSVGEQSLLRFNVSGLAGPAVNARLRVWVANGTTNGPVVRTAANTWDESAVTWNTRPAVDPATVTNAGAVPAGAYYEFDVTSAVTGNGLVTFMLVPESGDGLDINSKEATANRPQLVVTGTSGPDLERPTVTATSPFNGATGVSTAAAVTATFSEAVAPATLDGTSFTLRSAAGSVAATLTWDGSTRTARLAPSAPLAANTTYTTRLTTAITDVAGNPLNTDTTWTFTTQATATPPNTTILTGPPSQTTQTSATFTFTADFPAATFRCALDGAATTLCTSPLTLTGLASGTHRLDVTAVDSGGLVDPTPASWNWTIGSDLVVPAQADTTVIATQATTNFGAQTELTADGSPQSESLIRFAVSGTGGSVTRAILRVNVTNTTANGPAVYLTHSTWTESTVNWNTRPARVGTAIVDVGAIGVLGWYEFDVTPAVSGDGTYSFNLASLSSDAVKFSSREVPASAPRLVITR